MNRQPRNRRKLLLIALGLACIVLTVSVVFLDRFASDDAIPVTSLKSLKVNIRDSEPSNQLPQLSARQSPNPFQSASATLTRPRKATPREVAKDVTSVDSAPHTLPARRSTVPSVSKPLVVAVVDVERLLAELLPQDASPDARARTIGNVQQAVSGFALAHGFDLVFDSSAKSLNNLPVVYSAAGARDLTDELRQELAQSAGF